MAELLRSESVELQADITVSAGLPTDFRGFRVRFYPTTDAKEEWPWFETDGKDQGGNVWRVIQYFPVQGTKTEWNVEVAIVNTAGGISTLVSDADTVVVSTYTVWHTDQDLLPLLSGIQDFGSTAEDRQWETIYIEGTGSIFFYTYHATTPTWIELRPQDTPDAERTLIVPDYDGALVAVQTPGGSSGKVLTWLSGDSVGSWQDPTGGPPDAHVLADGSGIGSAHTMTAPGAGYFMRSSSTSQLAWATLVDGDIPATMAAKTITTLTFTTLSSADADAPVATIGRAQIGNVGVVDVAGFSHRDRHTSTDYGMVQSAAGATALNAATGQDISFRINAVAVATVATSYLHILANKTLRIQNNGTIDFVSGGTLDETNATIVGRSFPGHDFADHDDAQISGELHGDILFHSTEGNWENFPGNITTTRKFLRQTGSGAVSADPVWDTLLIGDLPTVTVAKGGTGLTTWGAAGRIAYSTAATTVAALAHPGATKFFRASSTSTLGWEDVTWTNVTGKPTTFSPAAHVLDNAAVHTISGKTPGYFLKALTATTFGFAAHGLSATDVGAQPTNSPTFTGVLTTPTIETTTVGSEITTANLGSTPLYVYVQDDSVGVYHRTLAEFRADIGAAPTASPTFTGNITAPYAILTAATGAAGAGTVRLGETGERLHITTQYGSSQIGMGNTTWFHHYTDATSGYYFDKALMTAGNSYGFYDTGATAYECYISPPGTPTAPRTWTFPDITGTVAMIAGSQTFLSKTMSTGCIWQGTDVGVIYGGTGLGAYVVGDLLYASATTTLARRGIGSTGDVLTVVGGVPAWAALGVGSHDFADHADAQISGEATGDILFRTAESNWENRAKGAANTVLRSTSTEPNWWATGAVSASGAIGVTASRYVMGGTMAISHSTAAGYKHIPTGGAANNMLKYSASGTAVWEASGTVSGSGPIGVTASRRALGGALAISHSTAAGYKHIPTGGATDQWLKYSASGTAVWSALPGGSLPSATDEMDMLYYNGSAWATAAIGASGDDGDLLTYYMNGGPVWESPSTVTTDDDALFLTLYRDQYDDDGKVKPGWQPWDSQLVDDGWLKWRYQKHGPGWHYAIPAIKRISLNTGAAVQNRKTLDECEAYIIELQAANAELEAKTVDFEARIAKLEAA